MYLYIHVYSRMGFSVAYLMSINMCAPILYTRCDLQLLETHKRFPSYEDTSLMKDIIICKAHVQHVERSCQECLNALHQCLHACACINMFMYMYMYVRTFKPLRLLVKIIHVIKEFLKPLRLLCRGMVLWCPRVHACLLSFLFFFSFFLQFTVVLYISDCRCTMYTLKEY